MPAKEDKKAFRCYGGKRLDCRRGKTKTHGHGADYSADS